MGHTRRPCEHFLSIFYRRKATGDGGVVATYGLSPAIQTRRAALPRSLAIFPARRSSGSADPRGGYVLNFENRAGASERASCRACLWSRFGPPAPAASRSLRHQVMDHLVRGAAAARGGRLSAPLRPHRATRSCSPSLSGDDVFRRWCRRQTDLKRLKTRTAGPMTAVGRSAGQRFFMAHPKP
jgi:hypothetical protein